MKTYKQIKNDLVDASVMTSLDYDDELMSEGALRNIGAAVLVTKIRSLAKKVDVEKIKSGMSDVAAFETMLRQNKLMSQQNFYLSLLISQLGIMNKENKR